jgi:hypothetical protein
MSRMPRAAVALVRETPLAALRLQGAAGPMRRPAAAMGRPRISLPAGHKRAGHRVLTVNWQTAEDERLRRALIARRSNAATTDEWCTLTGPTNGGSPRRG